MIANSIGRFRDFDSAEKILEQCGKAGVDILFYTDKNYPKKLKQTSDSPVIIYFKGSGQLNNAKTISVVGTRKASNYGKEFVEKIIAGLKPHEPLIISGLAYGIDIHAHRVAIREEIPTIAVMASGLDIIYPSVHRSTAYEMLEHGGWISENQLGTKPEAHLFPARNRIIAGMADATIVVEAAERGGALITAELANSYNRDVFATPGNINRYYSRGCNNLIKNHKAHLISGVEDLEYIMNWEVGAGSKNTDLSDVDWSSLAKEEVTILKTLKANNDELTIDDLSWKSQIPLNQLAAFILNLEFQGLVKSLPGKKYRIV